MKKQIIQVENINFLVFKNEILNGVKELLTSQETNNKPTTETYLTRDNVAKLLSISLVTLWKYTKEGLIPAYRIGSKVRYKESDVVDALKRMNKNESK
jgi:excisionase family DNA binding protein